MLTVGYSIKRPTGELITVDNTLTVGHSQPPQLPVGYYTSLKAMILVVGYLLGSYKNINSRFSLHHIPRHVEFLISHNYMCNCVV